MTISRRDQGGNIDDSLRLMLEQVGDQCIEDVAALFDVEDDRYSAVLKTTWRELGDGGFIVRVDEIGPTDRFTFTPWGWHQAHRRLGIADSLHPKLSRLAAALKSKVDGREEDAVGHLRDIAAAAGLSEGFVYNAIMSHALEEEFNIRGARFQNRQCSIVRIPLNFGHRPLL